MGSKEINEYICPVCGFIYQVPDYWADHDPERSMEFVHMNLKTKELCIENMLVLSEEK